MEGKGREVSLNKKGKRDVQSTQKEDCCEGDLLPYSEAETPHRDQRED